MKKLTFTIIFMCIALISFTQIIQVGPRMGVNYSIYDYGEHHKYNGVPLGYNIGLLSQIKISDKFCISPEVSFEKRIIRSKTQSGIQQNISYNSFINVITPINYSFGKKKEFQVFIGPSYSYLLKYYSESLYNSKSHANDLTEQVKRNVFGYQLGFGYLFEISNDIKLLLNLDYTESLFVTGNTIYKENGKYRAVRFNIGVLIAID